MNENTVTVLIALISLARALVAVIARRSKNARHKKKRSTVNHRVQTAA